MTKRRRWLVNLGVALAACVSLTLLIAVGALVNDFLAGNALHFDLIALALFGGLLWIPILIAIPIVLFLALVELVAPWILAPRFVAVVLGAVVLSGYGVVTQTDGFQGPLTLFPGLVVIPALGAAYGALVKLPRRMAT
jgi:hypothetical protein